MKTAFTKKDLLVTLACVVFLLINIAAVGPRGRRHAKEMLCLSNLYKWGEIFQAFAADNDGFFMKGWHESYTPGEDYWMAALRPYYANNDNLRCCPEATIPGTEIDGGKYGGHGTFVAWGIFDTFEWGPPALAGDYGSYGMNGWACNAPPYSLPWGRPDPRTWWRGPNAAGANNIPLFLGSQWVDGWPEEYHVPPDYDGQPAWDAGMQMGRFCINRHQGYVNSAFLDFSARKVGLKELWKLKWHRTYNLDGPWTIAGGVQPGDWPEWMQDFEDY
ncbi:MAG: hypothetical protein ACYSU6_06595 [Planctomycetota bacterium]|jgi:hypothetical protein